MNRLLTFGLKHPIPVLGLGLVYAVLAILYHEDAQELVRLIQRDPMWTWGAGGISLVGLGYFGWSIRRSIGVRGEEQNVGVEEEGGGEKEPRVGGEDGVEDGVLGEELGDGVKVLGPTKLRRSVGGEFGGKIWAGLIVFAVAGYVLLMSYPTEVVHYLQFGILGVLLSVALRRVDTAFVLTVVFGMLDEAYQYWWLHRAWGVYYDFNDVLLNIIAAVLGLATVATLWPGVFLERKLHAETRRTQSSQRKINRDVLENKLDKSPSAASALSATLRDTSFFFGILFFAVFALGVWTDLIAIQAADVREHTLLLLNRMRPFETFWETFNGATSQHHVVRAWWGVLLTALMTIGGVRVVEELRKELGGRS